MRIADNSLSIAINTFKIQHSLIRPQLFNLLQKNKKRSRNKFIEIIFLVESGETKL